MAATHLTKKKKSGATKAGEVGGINKKNSWQTVLQLIRLIGNSSVSCLGN